jgi:hypothetical protein
VNTTDILLLVLAVAAAFWPKLGPILGLVKKNDPASSADQMAKIVADILAKLGNNPLPAPTPPPAPPLPPGVSSKLDLQVMIENALRKFIPGPTAPQTFTKALTLGDLLEIESKLRANGRPRTAGLVAAAAADLLVEEPKTP